MVMGCVFKHHVYLCVVSTAMLAGLSLITSHTKAYAQSQNCTIANSKGDGVVDKPIVCDKGATGMLNTSGGGSEIEIDMSKHPDKEAVKIMSGANIMIMKKLKVTGMVKGSGPVIKVERGGKLMLLGEVDVEGVTGMKKVIMVEGGMVVLGDGVKKVVGKGVEKVIEVNGGGTLMMMGEVEVEGVTEGININGSKGVEFIGTGKGTLMLNMVEISGFETGVEATAGTLKMMGTTITVKRGVGSGNYGVGVGVSGSGTVEMMGTKIVGDGGTGVYMGSSKTLKMTSVGISGVEKGVYATNGRLEMMGGIGFTGDHGVYLDQGGVAFLGEVTIKGSNQRQEGIKLNGRMVDLYKTNISEVHKGITIRHQILSRKTQTQNYPINQFLTDECIPLKKYNTKDFYTT
ncbi:hypothetical protein m02_10120 [Bartonella bovis m02]|uniref:Right handed beta helix domain-containing protein n=2 Tax=Bartonella bovis TaxID=155194 RepID=N6VPC5_9HYPH|nr:hypothetical protein m02_10120 [Bartonella bovis m02]